MKKEVRYVRAAFENWAGLESLFETSEECKQCWCMNHRLPPEKVVTGPAARHALQRAIEIGEAKGILAFSAQQCVGWCAIDSVRSQPGHDYCLQSPTSQLEGVWSIHCLYVHPGFRGQGVSSGLIRSAIDLAKEMAEPKSWLFPFQKKPAPSFLCMMRNFPGGSQATCDWDSGRKVA